MFKRMKKFYKNNRIYCILMIISVMCILIMGFSVIFYFVNQNASDPYGNRIENIDDYKLGNSLKDIEAFYKENENVLSVTVRQQKRIIYITCKVKDEMKNEDIQNLALASLDKISEENKTYYDIQFIFNRDAYTPYMGSKTSNRTVITWTKFSYDTKDSTTTSSTTTTKKTTKK